MRFGINEDLRRLSPVAAMPTTRAMMAVLNIRNLPDQIRDRLRVRAAKAGRSMEAEARAILTNACDEPSQRSALDLPAWVDQMYGARKPRKVVEDLIAERRRE